MADYTKQQQAAQDHARKTQQIDRRTVTSPTPEIPGQTNSKPSPHNDASKQRGGK